LGGDQVRGISNTQRKDFERGHGVRITGVKVEELFPFFSFDEKEMKDTAGSKLRNQKVSVCDSAGGVIPSVFLSGSFGQGLAVRDFFHLIDSQSAAGFTLCPPSISFHPDFCLSDTIRTWIMQRNNRRCKPWNRF
jgi:hypothetical protein